MHLLTELRDKQHYFRHATLPVTRIITVSWLYARSIPRRSVKPVNPRGDPYECPTRAIRGILPPFSSSRECHEWCWEIHDLHVDSFIHEHRHGSRYGFWMRRIIASVISSDDGRRTDVRAQRERRKKRADGCQKYYADKIFMIIGTRDRDRLYFPRWIEMVPPSPTRWNTNSSILLPANGRKREVPREICYAVVGCVRGIIIGVYYLSLFAKNYWQSACVSYPRLFLDNVFVFNYRMHTFILFKLFGF